MLLLKILGGLVALAVGIWLGRPGHYDRNSDIDEILDKQDRNASTSDVHFTRMELLQGRGTAKLRSRGAGFRVRSPGERE